MSSGPPRKALVVPESAIMDGEKGATVYVVGDRDVIQERVVKLGKSHGDIREIREGLKAGERVVAGDLANVRPGEPFKP
jgi:membrane fusion protein, multidrug efflux system